MGVDDGPDGEPRNLGMFLSHSAKSGDRMPLGLDGTCITVLAAGTALAQDVQRTFSGSDTIPEPGGGLGFATFVRLDDLGELVHNSITIRASIRITVRAPSATLQL